MKRRNVLIGMGGLAAVAAGGYWYLRPRPAPVGFTLPDDVLEQARTLMTQAPVVDAHAHPGRTFVRDAENISDWKVRLYAMRGSFEDRTIADMREGGVAAAVFNGVADFQILSLSDRGLVAGREFEPGEAWASYQRQIANLRGLADDGLVRLCLTPDDVLAAHSAHTPGAILAMEGTDFLENDVTRLDRIFADGVRMVTLVHYHDNSVGHIMTGVQTEQGLTDFGAEVVARADDLGLMLDLSHASEPTAFGILDHTRKPAVLTHTHINDPTLTHPRFVSRELAQAVAERGGYIGAWPAGIGQGSLREFVDRIEWLIEVMGADHVAMGSDMDANYKPVLETYRKMPLVVGALIERGHDRDTIIKLMGGNVLRVWGETLSPAT